MGDWQLFFVISFDAQNELNVFKACDRDPGGACGESQELFSVLVVEVLVNYFPEPFHELVVWMERLDVFGHSLQLLEIQVFGSTNELLQLLWAVQVTKDVLVEDLVEPSFESHQLDCTELFEEVLNVELNELVSVFFGYKFFFTSFYQFDSLLLTHVLEVHGESPLENVLQRSLIFVVKNVLEALSDVGLPSL